MNATRDDTNPSVDSILHPTDFSEGSRVAFHHALRAALTARSRLTLLHVSPGTVSEWADFPGVRETLERWGLLPKDSPRSAVPQLGTDVRKAVAQENDPVKAVLHFLDPVAGTPRPQPAVEAAALLVSRLNCSRGVFTLLHVGGADTMPTVQCPEVPGWI